MVGDKKKTRRVEEKTEKERETMLDLRAVNVCNGELNIVLLKSMILSVVTIILELPGVGVKAVPASKLSCHHHAALINISPVIGRERARKMHVKRRKFKLCM